MDKSQIKSSFTANRIQGRSLGRHPLAKQGSWFSGETLAASNPRRVGLDEIIEGSKGL